MPITQAKALKALPGCRGIKAVVARKLGCHRTNIDPLLGKFPRFRKAFEAEKEVLLDDGVKVLAELAVDDRYFPALKFMLATVGRDRGFGERLEFTGAGGGPAVIEVVRRWKPSR